MNTKKYISGALALATVAATGFALPLFADTNVNASVGVNTNIQSRGEFRGMMGERGEMMRPAVAGTVSAISGNTLTVTAKQFSKPADDNNTQTAPTFTTVTYTVDATNATVTKVGASSSVSAIAVGDTIAVQGTVSGTNVVATTIRDGVMMRGQDEGVAGKGKGGNNGAGTQGDVEASLVAGNGQPVIGGTIATISGTSLTMTNKGSATYSIDASSAKFLHGSSTISISSLKVGDSIVVQGTVNGTSITASTIIDQNPSLGQRGVASTTPKRGGIGGFFGGIGSLFAHIFGF